MGGGGRRGPRQHTASAPQPVGLHPMSRSDGELGHLLQSAWDMAAKNRPPSPTAQADAFMTARKPAGRERGHREVGQARASSPARTRRRAPRRGPSARRRACPWRARASRRAPRQRGGTALHGRVLAEGVARPVGAARGRVWAAAGGSAPGASATHRKPTAPWRS
jgi:hypothetical protein